MVKFGRSVDWSLNILKLLQLSCAFETAENLSNRSISARCGVVGGVISRSEKVLTALVYQRKTFCIVVADQL
jgi:hypothetical protein